MNRTRGWLLGCAVAALFVAALALVSIRLLVPSSATGASTAHTTHAAQLSDFPVAPGCPAYCGPRDETPHVTTAGVHLAATHLVPDPLHARPIEPPRKESPPPVGHHVTPLDPPPVL